MTPFEAAALSWYTANAGGWAARVGITAREFERLRLRGPARALWIEAMQRIDEELRSRSEDD